MKFCVLASGSKGNAIWVEADGAAVLVDSGLSGRELMRRVTAAGLNADRLEAVLVSHEHRDHVSGAGVAARKFELPVYINQATLNRAGPDLGRIEPRLFETGHGFRIGALDIHPFSLSHDAADTVGFTFESDRTRLGVATDLGAATNLVRERLSGCRALIVEANHDPQMLVDGPYPWDVKKRVRGRRGHLSNQDTAELLAAVAHQGLTRVVLAHLSEVNNHPELALDLIGTALAARPTGLILEAAGQYAPGPVIEI